MAELTFKSPGVSTREIDLVSPSGRSPLGTPAGVIGTSLRGPAFVPVTFATFQDFVNKFGNTDGEKFGPLAISEWMAGLGGAGAGTFVRVLGIGNGKNRNVDGSVTNAGFVVGQQLPNEVGNVSKNRFANKGSGNGPHSPAGRAHFLGCFMRETTAGTIFTDTLVNGFKTTGHKNHFGGKPGAILRGILMAPSGVVPTLSSSLLHGSLNTLTSSKAALRVEAKATNKRKGLIGSAVPTTMKGTVPDGLNRGDTLGDVVDCTGDQLFTLLLNGHRPNDLSSNTLELSFNPNHSSYFANKLNTDPTKIQEYGHYLYAHWDYNPKVAIPSGSQFGQFTYAPSTFGNGADALGDAGEKLRGFADTKFIAAGDLARGLGVSYNTAFCLTSSLGRNVGHATSGDTLGIPDFENFQDRFSTAKSPFVVSQHFGGNPTNLFRFHALDDGAVGAAAYKVTIANVRASDNLNSDFGKFDVLVRKFDDTDKEPKVLEQYRSVNLDPSSDRFIAKAIGDVHTYYDFDKKTGGQKLVIEGTYPNVSSFVRVELSRELSDGSTNDSSLPMGFRGLDHLVTSGSAKIVPGADGSGAILGGRSALMTSNAVNSLEQIVQPPLPMRDRLSVGMGAAKRLDSSLTWGIQWEEITKATDPNLGHKVDASLYSHVKYYPSFHTALTQSVVVGNNEGTPDVGGSILDADRFNNNFFHLERICVLTQSSDGEIDKGQWGAAKYSRSGRLLQSLTDMDGEANGGVRFLKPSDLKNNTNQRYAKFTFPLQGGFDGVNIFDRNKSNITDIAVKREMSDEAAQGAAAGPSVSAIRKGIDVMEEKSDVDIQLLAIPGFRHAAITDYALESVERRFDALYLMDIDLYDTDNTVITGSNQVVNIGFTSDKFANRSLDSSFAAAYAPDVVITDPALKTNVTVPPSVAVLGAIANSDRVAQPWFAPAGFNRTSLNRVHHVAVELNRSNLDDLYDSKINPITTFPENSSPVIFGQKTLLATESALDRINVRRLLIDVRRKVRAVANGLLFEPNRASTLARFSKQCSEILAQVQATQGVSRFLVKIDASTTTQADIENNTVRGKIFLQPVKSLEFVSLDFEVSNAGADI